jgi:hypothetical protein
MELYTFVKATNGKSGQLSKMSLLKHIPHHLELMTIHFPDHDSTIIGSGCDTITAR